MNTITLTNVKYDYKTKYQTVHALNGADYKFNRGTFYAVMGKSGSGKTTLLSMIAGLDNPTTGEVYIDETNIAGIDRNLLKTIDR